jgi:ketosteroid isomerase-like protein
VSQENVEVVRRSLAAFSSEGIDGAARSWDAQIDWRAIEGAADDIGIINGLNAMRRWLGEWFEMFEDVRNEPEELIDAPGDHVVAVQRVSCKSRRTGLRVESRYAVAYTVRDGKINRGREYRTRGEALKAVGLEE